MKQCFLMNELFPEPSHEGEAGMVVTVAIKSMSDAPKAAGPFGRSHRPAAALKTSVPTICQNKLLPARLGKLHHPSLPTPHHWAVVHVGSVFLAPHGSTAQLWGRQPCSCRGAVVATSACPALLWKTSPYTALGCCSHLAFLVRNCKNGEVEDPTSQR